MNVDFEQKIALLQRNMKHCCSGQIFRWKKRMVLFVVIRIR